MRTKIFKVLSILIIMAIVMMPTVQAASKKQIGEKISFYGILGDVNGDRKITSEDSLLILKYTTGAKRLNIFQKKRADVNNDGKVNSSDSNMILKYISNNDTNQDSDNKVNVASIKVTGATEMYEGETIKLTAQIEPSNATDKKMEWSSNSTYKATVDQNGNVTAKNRGTVKIKAEVDGKSTTHTIEIKEKEVKLDRIEITKTPDKKSYNLNDTINTNGLEITAVYNNGKSEKITRGFEVSPKELNKVGKQEIEIKYKGLTAKYSVDVGAVNDLGKVKMTLMGTVTNTSSIHLNKAGNAWVVNNCVSDSDVKASKVDASKNYVSSGAISLYLANKILKQSNNAIINYQVKENDKFVSYKTNWTKGNYTGQDYQSFAEQMNKIGYELKVGNPVAIAVSDKNGTFRYVLAYAMTKPNKSEPEYTAYDIYTIDPIEGKWTRLSDYYQFTESGKVVYRIAYLNRQAVTKMTMTTSKQLNKGETVKLTPEYFNASSVKITIERLQKTEWTSSNTSVATVDKNGKVTAKSKGTATITAVAYYSKNKSTKATCKITVGESFEGVELKYSAAYNVSSNPLTKQKGVVYFNGHKETYYSQKVLPGPGLTELNNNGRHVADDGTIRDKDGYIAVACNYLSKGSKIMTSLGPGKVYDRGDMTGKWIDIYVNW